MNVQEYSNRLGHISETQFQKALDKFGLGTFAGATKIPFGNFGQNVFVTSSEGEFVLRGRPHDPTQFEREKFIAGLFHDKTEVPVPYPYYHDGSYDIFGWEFVIMPKMPGIQLADPDVEKTLSREDDIGIAAAMAKNLSKMQKLTWPSAGEYGSFSKTVNPFGKSFFSFVEDRIMSLVEKSMTLNVLTTRDDKHWIEQLLREGRRAIEDNFSPTIVMQDYKLGNAVARKESGNWEISGIFDFQEWYFGDGEIDLYRLASFYIETQKIHCLLSFMNEYLNLTYIRPGFMKRLPVYMMLDRMIIWEWAQRSNIVWWDRDFTLRQWGESFILKALEALENNPQV